MTTHRARALQPDRGATAADWIRQIDSSSTQFGPVANWPAPLLTAIGLVLAARHPAMLFWGPQFLCVLNDRTRELRGGKPPFALSVAPAPELWPECWDRLEPHIRRVLGGASSSAQDEWSLPVLRDGKTVDICCTLSCSAVPDPAAPLGIGGVLALCVQTTPAIIGQSEAQRALIASEERLLQTEEGLRQAQKMEALGRLTGGVAHDFNNLLGAMVGSFELIRRKSDDARRVRVLAEGGLRVAERAAKLTSQLLTFSRAQRIELTPVNLDAVLDGMRDLLRRTLGPSITVDFELRGEDCCVLSDPTQLEMAVLNLAINARDAMEQGGRLTVATKLRAIERDPALPPGDYLELLVRDNGVGMSDAVAARAFDPFFTTKSVGKGTGLGLSQVYGIARQAGGTVRIESRVGSGTTVRMLMPCTDAEPVLDDAVHAGPESRAVPDATVLLVDDDQDLRAVLSASLEDLGYRVLEAVDGPDGLDLLQQHRPDLMVADFAMPGMTGAELARAARRIRPDLPIIFASGHADTLAIDAAAGPATRVLRKPFRIGELQAAIEGALATGG